MIINTELLDELSSRARSSERLRASIDLRTSTNDTSQRILNALEPGTVVPIHRHHESSETVILVRGKLKEMLYNEEGDLVEEVILSSKGPNYAINIDKNQWHTVICLETGTISIDVKDGAYKPLLDSEILNN